MKRPISLLCMVGLSLTYAVEAHAQYLAICMPGPNCDCGQPDVTTCPGTSTLFWCDGRVTESGCGYNCAGPNIIGSLDCLSASSTRPLGGKNSCNGTFVGDPVDLVWMSGVVDRRDLSIDTPAGKLEVWRMLSTNRLNWWALPDSPLKGVAKLFGEELQTYAPYWKLNWTALTQTSSNSINVWALNGSRQAYTWTGSCTGTQALQPVSNRKISDQLYCVGSGEFLLLHEDGTRERFASPYGSGGLTFLTDVTDVRGNLLATVSYGVPLDTNNTPIANCPAGGTNSVPYIRALSGQSTYVDFRYATRGTGASLVCVLSDLRVGVETILRRRGFSTEPIAGVGVIDEAST